MKKIMKNLIPALLVCVLCIGLFACTPATTDPILPPVTSDTQNAPGTSDVPVTPKEIDYPNEIAYSFTDARPGYAEGTITVTAKEGSFPSLDLYYVTGNVPTEADKTEAGGKGTSVDKLLLSDYEKIGTVPAGKNGSIPIGYGTYLPAEATHIIAVRAESPITETTGIFGEYRIPDEKRLKESAPDLVFASVSDVHINYDENGYGASEKWTKALNFFAGKGVGYVMLSGDMTGSGTASEYLRYCDAIRASDFDESRIFEARGNHDSQQNGYFLTYTAGSDDTEIRPMPKSPYFYVLLENGNGRDNLFIFMAQELTGASNTAVENNFSDAQLDWLESLLDDFSGTETNIFILQHSVIHNFGPGDRYDGVYDQPMMFTDAFTRNLRFKSILTEYKEAIMMTGHTHLSLYDGVNFSDENGTSARMIHNSSVSQTRTYTSGGGISYNAEGKVNKSYGSEGYIAYVYPDCVVFVGYNLSTQKIIPEASYIMETRTEKRSDVSSIEITQAPVKTVYDSGEFFDPAGMTVTATLKDGTHRIVNGWGVSRTASLSKDDTEVEIYYGQCKATVRVTVKDPSAVFEGSGTADDPYLIADAEDFLRLTGFFNASTSESAAYGEGTYFRQTDDIDMTSVAGYNGTKANGNAKLFFGGIYDGNGKTLTVRIAGSDQSSVFPYLTGTVANLRITGSISGGTSAQPIRTVQAGGTIVNCIFDLELSAQKAHGISYSIYGTLKNVYIDGQLTGSEKYTCTETVKDTTKAENVFYAPELGGTGTKVSAAAATDPGTVVTAFAKVTSYDGIPLAGVTVTESKVAFGK